MNQILLNKWLENPSTISKDDVEDLKKAIILYPYFGALRVLLAKAENGDAASVKSAAAYVSHRPSLQIFLDTTFDNNINLPNTSGIEIEADEAGMLDTLSSDFNSLDTTEIEENIQEEPPTIEENIPIHDDNIVEKVEEEISTELEVTSDNTIQEDDLQMQILNDLEETNSTDLSENNEDTSNSIADEVLAELAKMSSSFNEEEKSEDLIEKSEPEVIEKFEVKDIEIKSEEPITENIQEEEKTELQELSQEEENEIDSIISSDEMMNRFQGFLDTRKKDEDEIINELTDEGSLDEDLLDFSKTSITNYAVEQSSEEDGLLFNETMIPVYDINLPDDFAKERNYDESVSAMNDENIIDFSQFNPESEISSQQNIIDTFIKEQPSISPLSKEAKDEIENLDLSNQTNFDESIPKTENFAKMLEKQGKKEEAISIYQHLILKNPNKATFFAERIQFLQKN